ncbi:MAG: alpha/beta hydrolase [Jaaginema sp. PMC 1080.18]|nr:alpha/beta hydrolase [Jaaginema sp. PMC 1080.18]MEC4867267.1 alpha/beta hydrolase [Jaaginema sp. PMC 1078.18]
MSSSPAIVWLSANPSFERFSRPLLRYLAQTQNLALWQYQQHPDEGSSLDTALVLLHDYIQQSDRRLHLVGHSTGGLLAWLYARQYPEKVQSVSLLGVGAYPGVDWQAHYYALQRLLPCPRQVLLAQMVRLLFGKQNHYTTKALIAVLEKDIATSPSPHSLYQRPSIAPGSVAMPFLVCGSQNDAIADINALKGWHEWLKPEDSLWTCAQGYHFFHYFYPQLVGDRLLRFWTRSQAVANLSRSLNLC